MRTRELLLSQASLKIEKTIERFSVLATVRLIYKNSRIFIDLATVSRGRLG